MGHRTLPAGAGRGFGSGYSVHNLKYYNWRPRFSPCRRSGTPPMKGISRRRRQSLLVSSRIAFLLSLRLNGPTPERNIDGIAVGIVHSVFRLIGPLLNLGGGPDLLAKRFQRLDLIDDEAEMIHPCFVVRGARLGARLLNLDNLSYPSR